MKHHASPRFWRCYQALPKEIRKLADDNYALLKADPTHGSLHFKKIGAVWSVRIGLHYRALATEADGSLVWFWIGSHAEYDRLVGRKAPGAGGQPTLRSGKRKAAKKGRRKD